MITQRTERGRGRSQATQQKVLSGFYALHFGHSISPASPDPTTFYFVTEAFFLTHYCLHVGLVRFPLLVWWEKTLAYVNELRWGHVQCIRNMFSRLVACIRKSKTWKVRCLSGSKYDLVTTVLCVVKTHSLLNSTWSQSPQAAMMRANLDRMKKQLEVMHRGKLAMDAHLLDPMLLQAALNFYAFSAKWLCHLVDPEARGCANFQLTWHVMFNF